jgi:hypothetical protein
MASSGFSISSSRSLPTLANQRLKGSALGLGMDWIRRKIPCVFQHWSFCRPPAVSNASARGGQFAPPLAVQAQVRVTPADLFPIVRRISGIRQRGNDVGDNEPPFIVVQSAPDFTTLKQRHAGLWIVVGFTHHIPFYVMSYAAAKTEKNCPIPVRPLQAIKDAMFRGVNTHSRKAKSPYKQKFVRALKLAERTGHSV